jgi:hypothetical protein
MGAMPASYTSRKPPFKRGNGQAGQRLVIQERNSTEAYDTIQEGETIEVIYRGDDMSVVLARARVGS